MTPSFYRLRLYRHIIICRAFPDCIRVRFHSKQTELNTSFLHEVTYYLYSTIQWLGIITINTDFQTFMYLMTNITSVKNLRMTPAWPSVNSLLRRFLESYARAEWTYKQQLICWGAGQLLGTVSILMNPQDWLPYVTAQCREPWCVWELVCCAGDRPTASGVSKSIGKDCLMYCYLSSRQYLHGSSFDAFWLKEWFDLRVY